MFHLKPLVLALPLLAVLGSPATGAEGDDPDWPCIQRKVPELSLGQVWTGPQLPPEAADWWKDEALSDFIDELAARRLPLADAQQRIREYRDRLPEDGKALHIGMLVQGLFDKMNGERSHVMSGIARYAHRQRDMAATLRRDTSLLDALRVKPDADQKEVAMRSEQLLFQTRIFQERAQSLTFVCEVPTLIEQRLYALLKILTELPAR